MPGSILGLPTLFWFPNSQTLLLAHIAAGGNANGAQEVVPPRHHAIRAFNLRYAAILTSNLVVRCLSFELAV